LMFIPVIALPSSQFTICLAVANVLVAAGSLIPMVLGGHSTDARLLIRIAKAPADSFAAIGKLWALDHAGNPPCSWPPELIGQLTIAVNDAA